METLLLAKAFADKRVLHRLLTAHPTTVAPRVLADHIDCLRGCTATDALGGGRLDILVGHAPNVVLAGGYAARLLHATDPGLPAASAQE